jgi:hypothetical protein
MNGKTGQISARKDGKAFRSILWFGVKSFGLISLIWGLVIFILVLKGQLCRQAFPVVFLWVYVLGVRLVLSSREFRMLPVSRQALSGAIWKLSFLLPMAVNGALCLLAGAFMVWCGSDPQAVRDNAVSGLLQLTALLGIMTAGPGLRSAHAERAAAPAQQNRHKYSWVLVLLEVAAVGGCVFIGRLELGHAAAVETWLCISLAAVVISLRFRGHLLSELAGSGETAAKTAGTGPVQVRKMTPIRTVWDHCYDTLAISLIVAVAAVLMAFRTLEGRVLGEGVAFSGILLGGTSLCIIMGFLEWRNSLRVWRMLPLGGMRIGEMIACTRLVGTVLPWLVVLLSGGLIEIFRGAISTGECVFCLGASMLVQGALLSVLPFALRRWEDTPDTAALKIGTFIGMFVVVMCMAVVSDGIDTLIRDGFGTYGWHVLAVGAAALCAGTAVSVRNTDRVLQHSDCYGRVGK